jgi:hypothetical protein
VDAFGVGAGGEADVKSMADAEDVAAFERSRRRESGESAKFRQGQREGGGFRAAGINAEGKDDRQLVEDEGGIFDEHGIGESGFGEEGDYASAELFEELFVGAVLFAGFGEVDGAALEEG